MKSIVLLALSAIVCTAFAGSCKRECKPGTHWRVYCNTCFCTENGTASCTKKFCPASPPQTGPGQVCNPGTTFKSGCNTCHCNDEGTGAICTEIACLTPIST